MQTDVAESFIDKLKEKQGDLSDQKFGERLGISKQLWQMLRTGKRHIPCPPIFPGIAKAHPELAMDVLIFLGFDVDVSSLTQDLSTNLPQTHCSGCQRVLRGLAKVFSFGFWSSKAN